MNFYDISPIQKNKSSRKLIIQGTVANNSVKYTFCPLITFAGKNYKLMVQKSDYYLIQEVVKQVKSVQNQQQLKYAKWLKKTNHVSQQYFEQNEMNEDFQLNYQSDILMETALKPEAMVFVLEVRYHRILASGIQAVESSEVVRAFGWLFQHFDVEAPI